MSSSVQSPKTSSARQALSDHYGRSNKGRPREETLTLDWRNIRYAVRTKNVKKSTQFRSVYDTNVILKNINGRAESGQLLAVMGPTGCGKTSLLNILAARMPSGGSQNMELSGQVCINGTPRNDDKLRRKSAYVLQDDNMFAHITVLETLTLASHFYLPTDVPDTIKSDLVMEIVGQLGLSKTLHTIIGNERDKGISGGERKRVNIAVQMLSQPMMLFLDEPTSGLDSFQALSVMECMKDLAMNGRLVVAVIHQPRSSIFELFDRLLLLSAGSTMFMGPAGDAMNWFQQCGFGCPRLYNPSDYFLDILSTDIRTVESEKLSNERIETFARMWAETETLESLTLAEGPKMVSAKADYLNCARITRNLKLLGWRAFTQSRRDLIPIFSKFVFIIFFALVIGGIFADLGNNQKSISNRIGLLFVIGLNQGFSNVTGVLAVFPPEKNIVNRERNAHAYDTLSYMVSKLVVEFPINTLPPVVFGCIIYFIVGLNPNRFWVFLLILMATAVAAILVGLTISAVAPNAKVASLMAAMVNIMTFLFAGFYINLDSLPVGSKWVSNLSFLRWCFEALLINEFKGLEFECGATGPCVQTGEQVLASLSFGGRTLGDAFLGLEMLTIGIFALAVTGLHTSRVGYVKLGHTGRNLRSLARGSTQQQGDHKCRAGGSYKEVELVDEAVGMNGETP